MTMLDIDLERLRDIRQKIFTQIRTLYLNSYNVRQMLPKIDLLINAVKWPPQVGSTYCDPRDAQTYEKGRR